MKISTFKNEDALTLQKSVDNTGFLKGLDVFKKLRLVDTKQVDDES